MRLPSLQEKVEVELSELEGVKAEVLRLLDKYRKFQDADYLGSVAMNLQSFYTGAERIFRAIAMEIDQTLPSGERWHQLLLEQMAAEIPTLRPSLLSEETRLALDELRRFRHVARSLYAFRLDPELIEGLSARVPTLQGLLEADCQRFFEHLQRPL